MKTARPFFLWGMLILAGALPSCVSGNGDIVSRVLGIAEPPEFVAAKAVSETEVEFRFSKPVSLGSLHFSQQLVAEEIGEGSTVRVSFSGSPGPGEKVTADLVAVDGKGNTLNVVVAFRTRNERIPPLRINEVRTEYTKPKAEFVELRTFGAGNLGAVRLFIASHSTERPAYEFPPVEVKNREYVTVHLRKVEEANIDELGSNLAESGGANASPSGRDLWVPGTGKLVRKTDIIWLVDQDDRVLDALVLSESADPVWSKGHFADAAGFLFRAGAWKSGDGIGIRPSDAVQSSTTTATRTINRDESRNDNSRSPSDWYITVSSGATPGRQNNPGRYSN